MAERAANLRKLNAFRRALPHVSGSALSSILEEVAQHGVPDLRSRWDLSAATALELDDIAPHGTLLHDVRLTSRSGMPMPMMIVSPSALPYKAASRSGFAKLLQRQLNEVPCSPDRPWRLVLRSDEVVPGNQLSHDNKRKLWVVYWSFLELGPAALARGEQRRS